MPSPTAALSPPFFPPAEWPFTARDFRRDDESPDTYFYSSPRIGVFHIDDRAVRALTRFYASILPAQADILDLCSSWVSHLPEKYTPKSLTALGISMSELEANAIATARVAHDLNMDPTLPLDDVSFDVVTIVVSVDYLTQPLAVFREIARVLRPGGRAIISFSNRCFPSKVVDFWRRTDDAAHVFLVGCYFHFAGGFEAPVVHDISPWPPRLSDPMFIVEAVKSA